MANNTGTLVTSAIRPWSDADTFPSAYADELKGGHHSAADHTAIPAARLEEGMTCWNTTDKKLYRYNGSTWVEVAAVDHVTFVFPGEVKVKTAATNYVTKSAAGVIVSARAKALVSPAGGPATFVLTLNSNPTQTVPLFIADGQTAGVSTIFDLQPAYVAGDYFGVNVTAANGARGVSVVLELQAS